MTLRRSPHLDQALPSSEGRAAYVKELFAAIASRYDRVNDLMTLGRHRSWKRDLVRYLGAGPGDRVLDVCSGTGDLALILAAAVGRLGSVTALDFSSEMLTLARSRNGADRIVWVEGDALALPFPDAAFDHVTVGFGLRNVASLGGALREIRRVLRPGGTAASLDLAKPSLPVLKRFIATYEVQVVPVLARLAGAPPEPYHYLPRSNIVFPDRAGLALRFEEAGFADVRARGRALGAVAILTATRPLC